MRIAPSRSAAVGALLALLLAACGARSTSAPSASSAPGSTGGTTTTSGTPTTTSGTPTATSSTPAGASSAVTSPELPAAYHADWFRLQKALAYDPANPYPWTRMGYTYDWGDPANQVGASEFLVR